MMLDRDLVANEEFQTRWREIVSAAHAAQMPPFVHFRDKRERPFPIYVGYASIETANADEHDEEALRQGLHQICYLGAVSDEDRLCYGAFGLYLGDNVGYAIERSLEVDAANRQLHIGSHLYWAAEKLLGEVEKEYRPTQRDTVVGQLFGQALQARSSPFADPGEDPPT